jgi:hypothetical protein
MITHSYKGSVQGKFRYSFYLLYEDYIQAQLSFAGDFDKILERFARNMKDNGVVVRPFLGDIESSRDQILSKEWTEKEKKEFNNTPGLLVIDTDFDEFNPRMHRWLYLGFGGLIYNSSVSMGDYDDLLTAFTEFIADPESDFFKDALPEIRELKLAGFAEIFEAKPGIMGFSIDLYKAATKLREMFR